MSYQVMLVGPNGKVVFDASPTLSEDGGANYDSYNIIHLPTSLYAYRNSDGRRFGINGQFISRNDQEAKRNVGFLDLLRAWRLPDFGGTGATPPILKLYAYKNKNIDGRQVVLNSYSFSFDQNTDYIYTASQPMPIIGTISIQLSEIYSAEQITAKKWKMNMSSQGGLNPKSLLSNVMGGGGGIGGLVGSATGAITSMASGALNSAIETAIQTNPIAAGMIGGVVAGLTGGEATTGEGIVSRMGNMIENSIPNEMPGKIAGTLVGAVGKTVLSNSKVQEAVNHLPGFAKNAFVSGANTLINQISKSTQSAVNGMINAPRQPISSSKIESQGIIET